MRDHSYFGYLLASVAAFFMLSLAAHAQVKTIWECFEIASQCKTEIDVGQSRENDEHCGRMMRLCQNSGPLPLTYSELGLRLIDRANRLFAAKRKMSLEEFRANYAPVIVELPNMICVGVNVFNATDPDPDTVCFDKAGEKIVLEYTPR